MTDSKWGPQDQSKLSPFNIPPELPIFKTRSISEYAIFHMGGPIAWTSKRQKITARSTAEAEIYAIDEAVKHIIHLQNICKDL